MSGLVDWWFARTVGEILDFGILILDCQVALDCGPGLGLGGPGGGSMVSAAFIGGKKF